MWTQALFSKTNGIAKNDGLQDEFHILTDTNKLAGKHTRRISQLFDNYNDGVKFIIKKIDDSIFIGVDARIGALLGPDHPYAREANLYKSTQLQSGKGRSIHFTHTYETKSTRGRVIPDFSVLCEQQKDDLRKILDEANNTYKTVFAPSVKFPSTRNGGTAWDKIATAVEAGKCDGGVFAHDGSILERFETATKRSFGPAQKKSLPPSADHPWMVPRRSGCLVVSAMLAGIGLIGWTAHIMTKRPSDPNQKTEPTSMITSRATMIR